MPLPVSVAGSDGYHVLPPGRWNCSIDDVHARFVAGRPDEAARQQLFDDWQFFWDQQEAHGLSVICHWVDGSFISEKEGPSDLDFTAVVDASVAPTLGADMWLQVGDHWKSHPAPIVNRTLALDAFAVAKYPDAHPLVGDYLAQRGYWDDWWQRSRATGEELVKGYVEVRR